jgi:hypothetical protein
MATAAYLQDTEVEASKVNVNSSLRYAAIGAAMGLLFGAVVAASTGNPFGPMMASDSGTKSPTPVTLNASAVPPAAPVQSAQKQEEKPADSSLLTPVYAAMIDVPATPAPKPVLEHHAIHRTVSKLTASVEQTSEDFPIATANSIMPPSAVAAVPTEADNSFTFSVEGDMNIADYDAATGRIETNDGKSFTVDKSAGDAMPLQDYSGNVHYRCDQGGSCTLMGNGVSVPNVRLTT